MDLPKELLQKHLPNANQRSEKRQDKATHGGKALHSPTAKAKKASKDGPVSGSDDFQTPDGDDDALFLQAMQGMVRESRKKKPAATHGAFPLDMPVPIAGVMPEPWPAPASNDRGVTAKAKRMRPQEATAQGQAAAKNPPTHAAPCVAQGPSTSLLSDSAGDPMCDNDTAFALAMRTVRPLKGKGRDILPQVEVVDAVAAQSHSLNALLDAEIVFDVHIAGESVQGQIVGFDPKVLTSLMSGSQSPEARLDLHGMNAAQAFQALIPFFKSAWHKGLRTVIVVTGRGINSPTGMAILRQKVSSWLTQEPFKRVVMAFSTAQPCDGGTGSMYVLLRKFRKKHPVYWERTPIDPDVF